MVFYTDQFIPERFAGYTFACFIFIRPSKRGDAGLLAHEQAHVKQFWKSPFLHQLRYSFSTLYRLQCEVEAYRVQLKYSPQHLHTFARFISDKYGLDVSEALALEALQ